MTTTSFPKALYASARASVRFALACLEPVQSAGRGHLRTRSGLVTPFAEAVRGDHFSELEGPGWATNTVGGALLLYRWGTYINDTGIREKALGLIDHVLDDGFIDTKTGLIWPYYDLAHKRFCLNYTQNNDWLCPGSLAKVGTQMLDFADLLPRSPGARVLENTAVRLAAWLKGHVPRLANGWVPRRITLQGQEYRSRPDGSPDPIFGHSADGLYLLELYSRLAARGLNEYRDLALTLGNAFISAGGMWGSLNHDTFFEQESIAFAVAYRVLSRCAAELAQPAWKTFADQDALPGLQKFRVEEDRQGVATRGLLVSEINGSVAYTWENAEAALAYLEHWTETNDDASLKIAMDILRAIACHHSGPIGFLTEGIDWNQHVARRDHVREALYGDISFTEPLLNNLHIISPTLLYLDKISFPPVPEIDDDAALHFVQALGSATQPPLPGEGGVSYLVRLYYPTLETREHLGQAIEFVRRCGADAVLLFESSYDMDPALLTMDALHERFAHLKMLVPRFREVVREVHINVMITIGHVDAGCAQPELFPFQFMVDEHGGTSRAAACPLDPLFLERTAEIYHLAARTGADAIWVDDDTRLVLHDLPGMTCFCPRHLNALEEKTGRAWDREALVAALTAEAEAGQAVTLRDQWFDVQEEAILGLARVIENAVHEINDSLGIGLMTIGTAYHAAEGRRTDRLLRTLAGKTRPMIRPGSGFYTDWTPGQLLEKTEDGARQVAFVGPDVVAAAEVENHPYTPFGKSNRILSLELALDILAGMPGLSLNLVSSMGGSGPVEPEGTDYAALLTAQRPFLDALAHSVAGRLRRGIGITCTEDAARKARLHGRGLVGWIEPRPWESILSRLGLPIGRPYHGPHWLAGETARDLSDEDLNQYLGEGLVLDPFAAQALLERGFGNELGLLAVRPVATGVNEQFTTDRFNGTRAGYILPVYNHIPFDQLYTWDLVPGSGTPLSRWLDVNGQDRGCGLVLLETPGGGRAVLLPYALRAPIPALLNIAHREQWAAALEWAGRAPLPCRITGDANLYPLAFQHPGDGSWVIAVANLSADEAINAHLEVAFSSALVETLAVTGLWQPHAPVERGALPVKVPAFSLTVLRFSRTSE
jgi:hypothetical protein